MDRLRRPLNSNLYAEGLITALWRSYLGAELLHLAVLRPSVSDSKPKYMTDRYQKGMA